MRRTKILLMIIMLFGGNETVKTRVAFSAELLTHEEMVLFVGKVCGPVTCSTNGSYRCSCCYCGVFNWEECSAYKTYDQCISSSSGSCSDSYRLCENMGSNYSDREVVPGRKCDGKDFCSTTNWKGVNYTGSVYCYAVYTGCN